MEGREPKQCQFVRLSTLRFSKMPPPECAVPAIAVSLIGTSIALAVLDLRRDWVDHATGAAFLVGMMMIGAGLPVFR